MKEKILWVCPSRKRPDRLERLIISWKAASEELSDLLVAIDTDDRSYDLLIKKYPEIIWEINDPVHGSFLRLTNAMALKYVDHYKFIGFMEDDVVFETPGYESKFINKLTELGNTGIVHAMDGVDKSKFVSLPVVNSFIVKQLGWFAPPCLKSLWADNFWRDMANNLQTYFKFEDIMIRHHHYKYAGTKRDEISVIVDNNMKIDKVAYYEYIKTNFDLDMKKLK